VVTKTGKPWPEGAATCRWPPHVRVEDHSKITARGADPKSGGHEEPGGGAIVYQYNWVAWTRGVLCQTGLTKNRYLKEK